MHNNENEQLNALINKAVAGDRDALEEVISSVRDLIFNLSLRMLGRFHDAEDATQDVILKVITHLSSFKQESAFSTWVFRITTNHLINYKKHMFAQHPLSFAFYGDDIENAPVQDIPDLTQNVEKSLLAEELKLSCTNVMLQCLDADDRLVFVLGTMFRMDSRLAGDILGITPETYRQRLSRIRRKVADFLSTYCGEYGSGKCRCMDRLNYAIQSHRLNPTALEYTTASTIADDLEKTLDFKAAMEEIDDLSAYFSFSRLYESPEQLQQFLTALLDSTAVSTVKNTALSNDM